MCVVDLCYNNQHQSGSRERNVNSLIDGTVLTLGQRRQFGNNSIAVNERRLQTQQRDDTERILESESLIKITAHFQKGLRLRIMIRRKMATNFETELKRTKILRIELWL